MCVCIFIDSNKKCLWGSSFIPGTILRAADLGPDLRRFGSMKRQFKVK